MLILTMNEEVKTKVDYHIEKEESGRIQFMKMVFCIMVVFIHSYTTEIRFSDAVVTVREPVWMAFVKYTISQTISRCAVPGFFMISAVLLYRKDFSWSKNVKSKIQSLLVPYFLFNTFWIVFFYFVHKIKILNMFFSSQQNNIAQWGMMEWLDAYLGIDGYPMLYPLWFVRDLFVLNIFAKVLKQVIDRFPKIWLAFIVTALALNNNSRMFFLSTEAVAFFSLGYYVVKYGLHFRDLDKIHAALTGALYAVLAVVSYVTKEMPIHSVFYALTNAAGILFWAGASRHFMNGRYKKKLLWAAKYNFSIYLFHEFCLTMLKKAWFKVFSRDAFLLEAAYFILPFIIVIFCIALSRVMEMVMPQLYRVLTGGRKQY